MKALVRKMNSKGTLGITLPLEFVQKMSLVAGQELEIVYSEANGAHVLIKPEEWAQYVNLNDLSDAELYRMYKEGTIKGTGYCGGYLMKRIEAYVERTKKDIIDRALDRG